MKNTCIIVIILFCTAFSYSQATVSGKVVTDNEPLYGVNIIEKNTNNGVTTDQEGKFTLKIEYTRQQIANILGLRVETVIRVIKNLEKKKELQIIKRKVFR